VIKNTAVLCDLVFTSSFSTTLSSGFEQEMYRSFIIDRTTIIPSHEVEEMYLDILKFAEERKNGIGRYSCTYRTIAVAVHTFKEVYN